MSLLEDIEKNLREIIDQSFVSKKYGHVPTHDNKKLWTQNTGRLFNASVLYIDMRGSTEILIKHNKNVVAKIHKSYYEIIIPIVLRFGGRIRSYNGDSMLVFFKGTEKKCTIKSVEAAMQINYAFFDEENGLNRILEKYTKVDFGIGIDYGEIMCTRIGNRKYSYSSDLIWIGDPVNKAVKMGDHARYPNTIYVSSRTYSNLPEELKFRTKEGFLWDSTKNLWNESKFKFGLKDEICYNTNERIKL